MLALMSAAAFCPALASIRASRLLALLLLALICLNGLLIRPAAATSITYEIDGPNANVDADDSETIVEAKESKEAQKCQIHSVPHIFSIMDKICELCHDLYSHTNANMRAQCRSDCFQSVHFKKCLHVFSPGRSQRHILRHRF